MVPSAGELFLKRAVVLNNYNLRKLRKSLKRRQVGHLGIHGLQGACGKPSN